MVNEVLEKSYLRGTSGGLNHDEVRCAVDLFYGDRLARPGQLSQLRPSWRSPYRICFRRIHRHDCTHSPRVTQLKGRFA